MANCQGRGLDVSLLFCEHYNRRDHFSRAHTGPCGLLHADGGVARAERALVRDILRGGLFCSGVC